MYYAFRDEIGNGAAPDGAVEITPEQYRAALDAKMDEAREALVVDGSLVIRERAPSPDHIWQNGEWVSPPEPEPEPPTLDDFRFAVQAHLDAVARERQYDSMASLASYAGSTVEEWAAEAQAGIAWRDAVWTYAIGELAKVQTGRREPPATVEAFIAELPEIEWPA